MVQRTHPYPYRTRKLSSVTLMILGGQLPGKVGRRWDKYSPLAQSVERRTVNPQVVGSSPTGGAMKKPLAYGKWFFQLNPPFRVGEILLRNVKSSFYSGEIAAAVGGFNFICEADFIHQRWISSCVSTISLTSNFTIHEMNYFTFCFSKIFH